MTTVGTADYFKYLSDNSSTVLTGTGNGSVKTFINSAWTLASKKATTEQKVKAGTNVVTGLLQLLTQKAEANAKNSTEKAEKEVKETQERVDSSIQKTYSAVQEKIDNIKELAEKIQENIEKTEAANKEKEEFQKELESHLEKLDEAQTIINNPESTKEEKQNALAMITDSRVAIEALSSKIAELSKSNEELVEETESIGSEQEGLADEQSSLMEKAQDVLETGVKDVERQTLANTATAATAAGNEANSIKAKVAAQTVRAAKASAAIPVAGVITSTASEVTAQKLDQISLDQAGAASVGFTSFAYVDQELTSTMNFITNNFSQYETFSNAIGGLTNNFESLSTNFYSVNEALGSWLDNASSVETQVGAIKHGEEAVAEQIENENPENESQKVEINTKELKKVVA